MRICVDSLGNVKGKNKNNAEHAGTARDKTYTGQLVGSTFKLRVWFPDTEQENSYEGTIDTSSDGSKRWKGTFILIKSTGHRAVGTGGKMEGKVREC